jgi:hypothetical protein
MRNKAIVFSVTAGALLLAALPSIDAYAISSEVKCPVVVDRQTGKYSISKAKYRCFTKKSSATKSGYSQHSFFDDSSTCSASPTPSPTPSGNGVGTGDYNLSGPGERESVVFSLINGGTVTYLFNGGGEFEIKVMNANNGKKIQAVLETFQASSGTATLAPQSAPVFVKVEGPGAWSVAIDVN